MKKIFFISLTVLAVMLLAPLSVLQTATPTETVAVGNTAPLIPKTEETVKVLKKETEKVEEMSAEDYVFGVVAGEMPALYETEALKAQAVCAYTFLKWRQKENADKGYDITDDFTTDQCYISLTDARKKWGSKASEYESKIKAVISEVKGQALTYSGEIILSVYHAVSAGATESAKNVWGKDYPYLQAMPSESDRQAKNYISQTTVTPGELKSALKITTLPENLQSCFSDIVRTESGTVKSIKALGKEFKGSDIRKALDLKSSNFEIEFKDNAFTFTAYGYGHGVGMSQNGANEMAKQGSTYEEILKHYYTGCEIIRNL